MESPEGYEDRDSHYEPGGTKSKKEKRRIRRRLEKMNREE